MKTTYLILAAMAILLVQAQKQSKSDVDSCLIDGKMGNRCKKKNGHCQKKGTCYGIESSGCGLSCSCCLSGDTSATQCASLSGSCVVTGSRCNGTLTNLFHTCQGQDHCTCCIPDQDTGCSSVAGGRVVGGQCLVFHNDAYIMWEEAKDACAAKGQVLAAMNDMQRLADYIKNNVGKYVYMWIGGSDAATEGQWVWLDGSSAGTIPWKGNNPDDGTYANCLQAGYNGYYDNWCRDKTGYICSVDVLLN